MAEPTPTTDAAAGERLLTPSFVLVITSALFYFAGTSMLLPTLPLYVEQELGGNGLTVGIVVGAFPAVAALLRISAGRLGDRYGRRILVLVGTFIVAVSLALYSPGSSAIWLIVVRSFGGIGDAGMFVGSATLAQDRATAATRGEAASYFSVSIYGGLAIGPVVGESLYGRFGANTTWLVAAATVACSSVLAIFIRDVVDRSVEVADRPQQFFHPAARLPGIIQFLSLLPFAAFTTFLALHIDDLGLEIAGTMFLLYGITVLFVRIGFAKLPDRLGPLRTTLFALAAIISGSAAIAVTTSTPVLLGASVVFGVGMSMLFPGLFTIVMNSVTDAERAHAVGSFAVSFDLSQAVGPAVLGLAVTLASTERAAFGLGVGFGLLAMVLTWLVLRPRLADMP